MRGRLTPEIEAVAQQRLGHKISQTELRLMPYVQYTMMNEQRLDLRKINQEERAILAKWRSKGWIEGGASGLAITKEFWDALSEILWLGYVAYKG